MKKFEKHYHTWSFINTLTLIFIVLKLCHVITWSWIWIFSPVWISFLVGVVCVILLVTVFKD